MTSYTADDLEDMQDYWHGLANARGRRKGRFDQKLIQYFFWKWEYDRRNSQYIVDYHDGVATRQRPVSPEYFFKEYKHVHLDPATGFSSTEILGKAQSSSEDLLPPEQFINDGQEEKTGDQFPEITIDECGSVRYLMDLNLPASFHAGFFRDHYGDIKQIVECWKGQETTVIFNDSLGPVLLPSGKRGVDDTLRRAVGLFLYDKAKELGSAADAKKVFANTFRIIAGDYSDQKLDLFLRRTKTCIQEHEVKPFKE